MQKILARCVLSILAARYAQGQFEGLGGTQTDFNSTMGEINDYVFEVSNRQVLAQDYSIEPPQSPAAFARLWDYLAEDICGEEDCEDVEYCVIATPGSQVCIAAQGEFTTVSPDRLIPTARDLFDRSVETYGSDNGVTQIGTELVRLSATQETGESNYVQVALQNRNKGNEDTGGIEKFVYGGAASLLSVGSMVCALGAVCSLVGQELLSR